MDEDNGRLEEEILGQGVFVGRFTHSLDPKKRLTIPSSWRAQMGESKSLYVLPDPVDNACLVLLPAAEMRRRMEKVKSHAISDPRARNFARVLASQSDLVSWDVQGRIRIKDELLERAGVSGQVVLVGAFEVFELWSPDRLDAQGGLDEGDLREAAQYVGF